MAIGFDNLTDGKGPVGILSALAFGLLAGCSAEPAPEPQPGTKSEAPTAAATPGASAGGAAPFRYEELCEASAAARLDSNHFAVASDDSERIAIYRRGTAAPIGGLDHPDVTDLEGATRIGDTIFWLTSHSLNQDGQDKKKRKILFATLIGKGPSLTGAGIDYRELRARMAAIFNVEEFKLEAQPDGTEKITGFAADLNIEGMAATADGALLLGLRKPLANGMAQIVRIENPRALVGLAESEDAGPQVVARPIALDLEGLGIRSIELVGTGGHSYLIVAGPSGGGTGPFKLFWWDGVSGNGTAGPTVAFGTMAPEALIAWSEDDIQILGDNEPNCSDKDDESDTRPRWFPSIDL